MHNFGAHRADGVRARLTADGRLGPEEPFDLPPGEDVPAVFRQQFTTPGDHLVEVSIDDDPLALDNHRWLVVPVRESLNVLLVDGHFKSEPYQAETDYLAQALVPERGVAGAAPADPGRGRLRVAALAVASWPPYDVVVLCNVAQFSQPEVTALDDFLKQGGGVVIFGGDQVVADNYNRLLYDDGKGLLPAADRPQRGRRRQEGGGLLLQSAGLSPSDRRGVSGRDRPGHGGTDPGAYLAVSQAAACPRIRRPRSRWRSTTAIRPSSRRGGTAGR